MDGFTVAGSGEKMGLLYAVERFCTGIRSKEAGRFSRGPGSRPPVPLSALSLLTEVASTSQQLHAELSQQVIGTPKRGPAYSCLQRLPLLASSGRAWVESVEDAEHATVRWVRIARLLLAEDRPPAKVTALTCPHCTGPSLRLIAEDGFAVGTLYCSDKECRDPNGDAWQWNAQLLHDHMAALFSDQVA